MPTSSWSSNLNIFVFILCISDPIPIWYAPEKMGEEKYHALVLGGGLLLTSKEAAKPLLLRMRLIGNSGAELIPVLKQQLLSFAPAFQAHTSSKAKHCLKNKQKALRQVFCSRLVMTSRDGNDWRLEQGCVE